MKKKLKVALVQVPPYSLDEPPLGIASIKAYLQNFDIEVKNYDLNIRLFCDKVLEKDYWSPPLNTCWWNENEYKTLKNKIFDYIESFVENDIVSKGYDIVGLSICSFASYNISVLLSNLIKKYNEKIIVVAGGSGCLYFLDPSKLIECNDIDIIVNGEGEQTFKDIIFNLAHVKSFDRLIIPGCFIKKRQTKIFYPGKNLIKNLDELPTPDYSDFDLKKYLGDYLPFESSRGCINNCTFCNERILFGYYRTKSSKKIFNDISDLINEYKISKFHFKDSLLNGNLKNLEEFCDLVIESNIKFEWFGQILIRDMSPNLIKKMSLASLKGLCMGLESGSQKILDEMNKNFKLNVVCNLIKCLHQNKIKVSINLMVGFPGESEEDFVQTLKFLLKIKPYVHVISEISLFHLDPGSYLSNNHLDYNIEDTDIVKWQTRDKSNTYKIRYIKALIMKWFLLKSGFLFNFSWNMKEMSLILDENLSLINNLIIGKNNLTEKRMYNKIKFLIKNYKLFYIKNKNIKQIWYCKYFYNLIKTVLQNKISDFCKQCNPSHTTQRRWLRR